ncbi:MAG: class I SAM-dependent methyltransferase [Thermoplasmata archaeon]|nr:class I SAM-dependent methyltransferase [Thermoplasmata archaeon]
MSPDQNPLRWDDRLAITFRYAATAIRHPTWISTLLSGGREALLRRVVRESLATVGRNAMPNSIRAVGELVRPSALSELGGTQDYLYFLVRLLKPDIVVETGVYRGISTAFILAGLSDNQRGRLISVDLPNASYVTDEGGIDSSELGKGREPGFLVPDELKVRWRLERGNSRNLLGGLLDELTQVDMFYHDSEHTYRNMTSEFETVLPHLRGGGILAADDVTWNSAFADFVARHDFEWSRVVGKRLGLAVVRTRRKFAEPQPDEPTSPPGHAAKVSTREILPSTEPNQAETLGNRPGDRL